MTCRIVSFQDMGDYTHQAAVLSAGCSRETSCRSAIRVPVGGFGRPGGRATFQGNSAGDSVRKLCRSVQRCHTEMQWNMMPFALRPVSCKSRHQRSPGKLAEPGRHPLLAQSRQRGPKGFPPSRSVISVKPRKLMLERLLLKVKILHLGSIEEGPACTWRESAA